MDKKKIQEGVKLILEGIGENPDREGLLDTPDRIARMYEEIFGGLTQTAEEPLSKTFHVKDNAWFSKKILHFTRPVSIILCLFTEKHTLLISRMEKS